MHYRVNKIVRILLFVFCIQFFECNEINEKNSLSSSENDKEGKAEIRQSCLDAIKLYADTLQIEPPVTPYLKFKNEKKFSLDNCDVEFLQDDLVFQKSVLKIILKLYLYDIKGDAIAGDLLPMDSNTGTTAKILGEYIYILYGRHESVAQVEVLFSSSVTFIKDRPVFKNDKELMRLLDLCYQTRKRVPRKHKYYY